MRKTLLAALALSAIAGPLALATTAQASTTDYPWNVNCTIALTGTAPSNVGYTLSCHYTGYSAASTGLMGTYFLTVWVNVGAYDYQIGVENPPVCDSTATTGPQCDFEYIAGSGTDPTCVNPTGSPYLSAVYCMLQVTSDSSTPANFPTNSENVVFDHYSYNYSTYTGTWDTPGGTALVTNSFGVTPSCTPTSQSGFYAGNGDGTKSFTYTYTYGGTALDVVGDPNDGDTSTITVEGKTFSADSVVDQSPTPGTVSENVTPTKGADPNNTDFWCYSTSSGWVDWGNAYSGGSGQTPTSITGCTLNNITGTAADVEGDHEYTLNWANTNQSEVVFEYDQYVSPPSTEPSNYSDATTIDGKTFNIAFYKTTTGDTTNFENNTTGFSANGHAQSAEIWCYSTSATTWVDVGDLSTFLTEGSGPTNNPSNGSAIIDCSNFPGISLGFDIGTDIGNAVQWIACSAEWLFIPTSWNAIKPDLTGKPPFLWVTDLTNSVTTMYNGLTNGLSSNNCTAPSWHPFNALSTGIFAIPSVHNFTIALPSPTDAGCAATYVNENAGELFGYRTWLRDLELFGITLAFLATIWRLLPWSHNSDAQIIDSYAAIGEFRGLNIDDWPNSTHVFQTNEGSDETPEP